MLCSGSNQLYKQNRLLDCLDLMRLLFDLDHQRGQECLKTKLLIFAIRQRGQSSFGQMARNVD